MATLSRTLEYCKAKGYITTSPIQHVASSSTKSDSKKRARDATNEAAQPAIAAAGAAASSGSSDDTAAIIQNFLAGLKTENKRRRKDPEQAASASAAAHSSDSATIYSPSMLRTQQREATPPPKAGAAMQKPMPRTPDQHKRSYVALIPISPEGVKNPPAGSRIGCAEDHFVDYIELIINKALHDDPVEYHQFIAKLQTKQKHTLSFGSAKKDRYKIPKVPPDQNKIHIPSKSYSGEDRHYFVHPKSTSKNFFLAYPVSGPNTATLAGPTLAKLIMEFYGYSRIGGKQGFEEYFQEHVIIVANKPKAPVEDHDEQTPTGPTISYEDDGDVQTMPADVQAGFVRTSEDEIDRIDATMDVKGIRLGTPSILTTDTQTPLATIPEEEPQPHS